MHRTNLSPHELALRAIAAIALTVPACSSATTSLQTAADAQTQTDTGTTATDAVADTLAGTDATAADAAATTDVALASDVASDSGIDSGIDTAGKPDCTPTPNVGECCLHLGEWCAQAFPDEADYEARSECQFGPGYDGSTGCSPWGPPAPPKFEPAAWGLA